MVRKVLICGAVLASLSFLVVADEKHELVKHESNAGFDKMKSLVGTWVMADEKGKPTEDVVSVIKLTAGGSALQETLFPGQPHEMISMYTVDGSNLVMTHYCMLGNQPRMKANTKGVTNKLNFEFDGGTNFDPKKDKHMHASTLTIVDKDHYEVQGVGWENGEPAKEMCGGMKLIRKK